MVELAKEEEKKDMDEAVRAEFKEVCMMYCMIWGAGSKEQQTTWQAGAAKLKGLFEESKAEMMAEVETNFAENSTDGVANEAQFIAFTQKLELLHAGRGVVMPAKSEALLKPAYECMNKWTEGKDGVSITDIWKQQELTPVIMGEIRKEAEEALE